MATRKDVEQMLIQTGVKERMHQMWAQMGQQMAITAAQSYHLRNPDATPMQVHKVQQVVEKSLQGSMSVVSSAAPAHRLKSSNRPRSGPGRGVGAPVTR